jgi:hypothetical protein
MTIMRKLICAALSAAALLSALPAAAQDDYRNGPDVKRDNRGLHSDKGLYGDKYDRRDPRNDPRYNGRVNNDVREEYRDEIGDAGPNYNKMRHSYDKTDRSWDKSDRSWDKTGRGWQSYRNYDYNRLPPGARGYYADQYYRDGSYYQPRRLGREDRIYRGSNGRYYCRRNDGTTGLIVGALAGGVLGNRLSNGRSSTLGTLLGVAGGAAIGSAIDRGQVTCR